MEVKEKYIITEKTILVLVPPKNISRSPKGHLFPIREKLYHSIFLQYFQEHGGVHKSFSPEASILAIFSLEGT